MKGINPAMLAEIVLRRACIKPVQSKRVGALEHFQVIRREGRRHERALASTQAAVATRRRRHRCTNLELHSAAMARPFQRIIGHAWLQGMTSLLYIAVDAGFCVALYL